MTDSTSPPRERPAKLPVWVVATIAGVFGLLYAYVVWNAATLLAYQASGVLGINGLGWSVLALAVLFPIIVYAIAFAIGWRRRALPFAAILLTGLALVAVFWVNILAYSYAYGGALLG
jgi:hypothetical protein